MFYNSIYTSHKIADSPRDFFFLLAHDPRFLQMEGNNNSSKWSLTPT